MAKRKGRVRVRMWDLWWMPEGKALKVQVKYPKDIRTGKRHKKARALYADGVAQGVVTALKALDVPSYANVDVDGNKAVND